jgi:hypothetical protein
VLAAVVFAVIAMGVAVLLRVVAPGTCSVAGQQLQQAPPGVSGGPG